MAASVLRRLRDIGETVQNVDEDVRGRNVLDSAGKKVGTVDSLMIDDDQKKVRLLRVECGGFLGLGATHVMIPVEAITNVTADAVFVNCEGERLHGAPRYDPALIDAPDDRYWGGVYGYFGVPPYWMTVGSTYPSRTVSSVPADAARHAEANLPPENSQSTHGASGLSGNQALSASIERQIEARMQPDAPPINVAVLGATVTLTGHVANQATKDALNQLARDTDGVINVTDNLVIGGGHPFLDWLLPGRDPNKGLENADRGNW